MSVNPIRNSDLAVRLAGLLILGFGIYLVFLISTIPILGAVVSSMGMSMAYFGISGFKRRKTPIMLTEKMKIGRFMAYLGLTFLVFGSVLDLLSGGYGFSEGSGGSLGANVVIAFVVGFGLLFLGALVFGRKKLDAVRATPTQT